MQNKRSLKEEIAFITTLKSVVVSNEEISVIKIQQIRDSVLRSRVFASGVSEVAQDVWVRYKGVLSKILSDKNSLQKYIEMSIDIKQGGLVSVIITPNRKLAGHVVPQLVSLFTQSVKGKFSDLVIIGRLGRELYEQSGLKQPYQYFEVSEDKIDSAALKPMVETISRYGRIEVYYGYFSSLTNQTAIKSNITGEQLIFGEQNSQKTANVPENLTIKHGEFLFEPTEKQILELIETQLLTLFFKQAVYESQLAQFGSRIIAMESALSNIDERMQKAKFKDRLLSRTRKNKKQQQLLSGLTLWM